MKNKIFTLFLGLMGLSLAAQLPVTQNHPRIFLDPVTKATLLAKKLANDPNWTALKAEADNYANRGVLAWNPTNTGVWNTNYIFYNYCGSSWEDAAYSLGFAHQLTKGTNVGAFPTPYSNKLLQLADTIISGYAAYPPGNSNGGNMFMWNGSYATRHMGPVLGVIYDWCYDELGDTRKQALVAMMEDFFDYMLVPFNVYQGRDHASGNYFFGQVLCAANMGYATMYDSPKAQKMIDYARQRVTGTHSGTISGTELSKNWLTQTFTGGTPTEASTGYLGPASYKAAPQKDGIPIQGWAYGSENTNRIIDYCLMVQSCTGEKLADTLYPFLSKTAEAFVYALTPNRFQIDPSNDWGSFIGSLLGYSLPLRLSSVLEGTPAGPMAQYVSETWVQPVKLAETWKIGYPEPLWDKLFFENPARPAAPLDLKPYYPQPDSAVWTKVLIDEALPKYYIRENWSDSATWITLNVSNAFYDDHDHHDAGHFQIFRGDKHDGDDMLLVGSNEVGNQGAFGLNGIGETNYYPSWSFTYTLVINDYNDYSIYDFNGLNTGGQSFWGYDEPTHTEQNDDFSYIRADLKSAYYRKPEVADTANAAVKRFQRSFLYLRGSDVVLSYDRVLVKNSTHQNGQYKKHLRWHFMENPVVTGNNIVATMDNSKLFVHTVIPATVSINKVNQTNNADNIYGPGLNYAFNTYTWRAEVTYPNDPLEEDFLTVFQPGALNAQEMVTSAISSIEQNMEGSLIQVNGNTELVLFNKSTAKYLVPVTAASYTFTGDNTVQHTLVGMVPNGIYQVDLANNTVSVSQSSEGNFTASPSGVLRYKIDQGNGIMNLTNNNSLYFDVYPNPATTQAICKWDNNQADYQRLEVINSVGQVIRNINIDKSMNQCKLNLEQSGVFTVNIYTNSSRTTRKLVVMQ